MCIICTQEEGIPVSPYSVRKALENTSVPIGDSPEDKLSAGQGLMQVDKFDIFPVFILKKIAVNCNIICLLLTLNK